MENETNETKDSKDCCAGHSHKGHGAVGGGVYGLAFVGAAIYYIQHADTLWMGVLGVLKALVWPALLIYKLLDFLKM